MDTAARELFGTKFGEAGREDLAPGGLLVESLRIECPLRIE
jgi:hypothetical protein